MGLTGNLRTMDLPEILQWISMGRKTGTLHLERRSVEKRIAFHEGLIFTSWSNDPRESLGQFLIRDGRLTEEQLFRALLRAEEEGRPLGALLVGSGLLTEDDLKDTLQAKAEESIYDLFLWPEGRFEFRDGEVPQDTQVRVELGVTSVTLEGIRRVDEWKRVREAFPSLNTTFRVMEDAEPPQDPVLARVFEMAAAGKSVAEIGLELRRSEFDTASLLYELYRHGLVAVASVGEERRLDPVGAIKDLLSLAYQRMQERRYDAAVTAYEEVLALDRLNQHAKKGLLAANEARNKARAVRSVPREKVPVVAVDLKALTNENFDPQEGFVLSRVNGQWDVQSILKLCPMAEEDALLIFSRLLERGIIELR
jgi:hypothetical protein